MCHLFILCIIHVFRYLHNLYKISNAIFLHIVPTIRVSVIQNCSVSYLVCWFKNMIVNFWQARILGEKLSHSKWLIKLTSTSLYLHFRNMPISSYICTEFAQFIIFLNIMWVAVWDWQFFLFRRLLFGLSLFMASLWVVSSTLPHSYPSS